MRMGEFQDEAPARSTVALRFINTSIAASGCDIKYDQALCRTSCPSGSSFSHDQSAIYAATTYFGCVIAGHEAYTTNKARSGNEWLSDGSKLVNHTDHGDYSRAGCSLTCGPLIVIAGITGRQTSYRAELQPPAMLTHLRGPQDTLTLDNQAVVRWCQTLPHRECADRDLREFIYSNTRGNPIPMRWIPGHRELVQACTKQDREDIWRNNEVDRWAKKAAGVPLLDVDPTDVSHIVIGGGHAPTLAPQKMDSGLPKYTWVPRGTLDDVVTFKRHTPAPLAHLALGQCAMGSVRRTMGKAHSGVPAMWEHHGTTAHQRLISCPKWRPSFINLWTLSWGEWHQQAHEWLLTATANDLQQVSCLQIPSTLIDTLPPKAKVNIRYRVAWF